MENSLSKRIAELRLKGLSFEEIGKILDISKGKAHSLYSVHRAEQDKEIEAMVLGLLSCPKPPELEKNIENVKKKPKPHSRKEYYRKVRRGDLG